MPNQWDLTGENIENTYQRVLQTPDGVNIFDGTGSAFTVTAVAAPAGPNQSIQFNDAGTTSGSGYFTFDKNTNTVYLTGSFIIDTASSAAALRITQTGTGEAIRVEDSTNPDATPFVIDATGRVGIGTSTPQYAIVASSSTATDTVMFFDGGTAANANLVAAADTSIKLPLFVLSDRNTAYGVNTSYWIGLDRSGSGVSSLYANRNDVLYVNNYQDKGHYFITNNGGSKAVRMVISGSGNVGIGTTTPTSSLHISSSQANGGVVIETSSSISSLRVTQVGDGNAILVEDSANPDSTPFVVASDGRVGIGVTAPLSTYKLHVRNGTATNSAAAAGTVAVFENNNDAYCTVLSPDTNVAGFAFGSNSDRTGALINWGYNVSRLAITTAAPGAYLWLGTDNQSERIRITSGGLVGINTTNPQYILDVSGSSKITGDLIVTGIIDGGTF